MAGREPAQITLTVFSARNLQSKRKGELSQASVVFGVGKSQYITETVESNNPEWNQEAVIEIHARHPNQTVKFKVRDKEHTLGVVLLSLNHLGNHRAASKQWIPLTPHKKGHEAFGELLVECFVSKYRPGQILSLSEKSSPLSSQMGSQEDILPSKKGGRFLHHRTPSWSKGLGGASSDTSTDTENYRATDSEAEHVMRSSEYASPDTSLQPQVTGISPHEGPVKGGERVVLRGSNLGDSKESVVRVIIADVDCTDTLEYFSPTKLAVTTPPRHTPGRGPVSVETVIGGVGVSSIMFAFVEKEIADPPEVTGISPLEGSVLGGERVVLRGSNLGECKEGVVRVVLGGVDCTETLEFFSPAKLVVTTLPRPSPGCGNVLVETIRGGASNCSLTFTYVEDKDEPLQPLARLSNVESSRKHHGVDLAELKSLKQQIKDLKDDNAQLKEKNQALMTYIDDLLLAIIETKPDILEIKSFQSNTNISFTGLIQ